jgi:hypothetical protein
LGQVLIVPLRLLGIQATHLTTDAVQMPLFADASRKRQQRVDAALDRIAAKFGGDAVRRGGK